RRLAASYLAHSLSPAGVKGSVGSPVWLRPVRVISGTYGPCQTPLRSAFCAAKLAANASVSRAVAASARRGIETWLTIGPPTQKPVDRSHMIRPERPRAYLTFARRSYDNIVARTAC